MQIQADLLGVTVTRPSNTETTVLGASYLAGLAVGFWQDQEEIKQQWTAERQFVPQIDSHERQKRVVRWREALERAKGWHAD